MSDIRLPRGPPPKDPAKRAVYDAARQAFYSATLTPDPGPGAPRRVRQRSRDEVARARERRHNPRRLDWEARWLAGETLEQIGQSEGLTRERIRQVIAVPGWLNSLRQQRSAARTRLRHYVNTHDPFLPERACCVCGAWMPPSPSTQRPYCSDHHREIVLHHLRYGLMSWDAGTNQRAIHQRAVLVNNARDDSSVPPYQRQYARDILAGRRPWPTPRTLTSRRGRWFVPGSMNYWLAMGLYLRRWPLFDDLHPDLQAEIRGDAPTLSVRDQARALCTLDGQPATMRSVYESAIRSEPERRHVALTAIATAIAQHAAHASPVQYDESRCAHDVASVDTCYECEAGR